MPDPLATVLRLRRVTVDDAKRSLAAVLRAEEAAQMKAEAAESSIDEEAAVASNVAGGDEAVEAFAAWLPIGRSKAHAARAEHEQLRSEVAMARAGLTAARAAAEAADALVEHRAMQQAIAASRREQASQDEIAGRRAYDDEPGF